MAFLREHSANQSSDVENQLQVALDNMPGALAYTDDEPKLRLLQ